MFDLSGKTALVTGASGGIGGAIARALHGQGARVGLSGTRISALESIFFALTALNSTHNGPAAPTLGCLPGRPALLCLFSG